MTKLIVLTLVLDGEPFIEKHFDILEKSGLDYTWLIVEGQAAPTRDTSWCKPMPPRVSQDGTHEYVSALAKANRGKVIHFHKPRWENKTAMCNEAMRSVREGGVLLQVDSDEIWTPYQLVKIVEQFDSDPALQRIQFHCKYFLGNDIVVTDPASLNSEWIRAWKFRRGMLFDRHEPPTLAGNLGKVMMGSESHKLGLVFDHFSYATEAQVAYKEKFYGYSGAVDGWKRLQLNQRWPAKVKDFLPWSAESTYANKVR